MPTPPESQPPSERTDYEVNDVPAAVLCAQCGLSDCTGSCEELTASGVFVLVPWERGDGAVLRRLFATSRAATLDAEPFFERLSDGPVMPALGFAVVAELFAALSLAVLVTLPLAFLFPELAHDCLFVPGLRHQVVLAFLLGVPGLAALLVLAHAAHGLSVDVGARRQGARSSRTRALRFGLYAAGWDLVMGPLGALVIAFTEGPRAALGIFTKGVGLPTVSTLAFLKNGYRLEGDAARRALRFSYWGAGLATTVTAFVILLVAFAALSR
ncbi:MAG: hypothetical protein IPK71_36285 [Myxococcales bacterium]|nr:hypothetical protein [Myxococcales bacterium]